MDENNTANGNQAGSAGEKSTVFGSGSGAEERILSEIKLLALKQVRWQRLSAVFMMGILTVVLVVVVILLPSVLYTLNNINGAVNEVSASIGKVMESVDQVDAAVAEMQSASKSLNGLVEDNAEEITNAVTKLSEVDYAGLNQAIQDLQDAVGPVASFFNKFR